VPATFPMDPTTPSSAVPASVPAVDARSTLLQHFPPEVGEAFARLSATRDFSAADTVILAVVRDHIPDKTRRAEASLEDHTALITDLGFDSMAVTEMVFFLEDLFQVSISNAEILSVQTVGDLRAFVRQKLTAQSAAASGAGA
jgi:acyl carrier protein